MRNAYGSQRLHKVICDTNGNPSDPTVPLHRYENMHPTPNTRLCEPEVIIPHRHRPNPRACAPQAA
jgi:hypothetical protein